jgi:hypothetical protein
MNRPAKKPQTRRQTICRDCRWFKPQPPYDAECGHPEAPCTDCVNGTAYAKNINTEGACRLFEARPQIKIWGYRVQIEIIPSFMQKVALVLGRRVAVQCLIKAEGRVGSFTAERGHLGPSCSVTFLKVDG